MLERKSKQSVEGNIIQTPREIKIPTFELPHGRKPRTELTNLSHISLIYLN